MRLIALLICFTSFLGWAGTLGTVPPEQQVPLRLGVRGVPRQEITAVVQGESLFVPCLAIFKYLHIKSDYDPTPVILEGFFLHPDQKFRIDAQEGVIELAGKRFTLNATDYVALSDEFYLRLELFNEVFGLRFIYSKRRLSLDLFSPPSDLPVLLEQARARRRRVLLAGEKVLPEAQRIFDQKAPLLGAGTLDWTLNGMGVRNRPERYSYGFHPGLQTLGGDLEAYITGFFNQPLRKENFRGNLTYTFSDPGLRQVIIGDFGQTLGMEPTSFGVEVTNRPPTAHAAFATDMFVEHEDSGNVVDIYSGGRLTGTWSATETGDLRMPIPLWYESNTVEFHTYDPWGTERIMRSRPTVPSSLMRPDEFRYSLSLGQLRDLNNQWYGTGFAEYGFDNRLTLGTGLEYLNSFAPAKMYPSIFAVSRLSNELVAELHHVPNARTTTTLDLILPSDASGSFSFTQYLRNPFLNPSEMISEMAVTGAVPIRTNGLTLFGSTSIRQTLSEVGRNRNLNAALTMFRKNVQLGAALIGEWGDELDRPLVRELLLTQYSIVGHLPDQILLFGNMSYDHLVRKFSQGQFAIGKRIDMLSVTVQYTRQFAARNDQYMLNLTYVLPLATAHAVVEDFGGSVFSQQNVSGSVVYSSETRDVLFHSYSNWLGFGDVLVNPFVDENNNGVKDPGEKNIELPHSLASFEGATVAPIRLSDDAMEFQRARPYSEYKVMLGLEGLANPLWVPEFSTFAVVAKPNRIQRIDVPIVVGGTIRGSVEQSLDGRQKALEGINVSITPLAVEQTAARVVKTFSTGEYEYFPLLPGKYTVKLDPQQLAFLRVTCEPAEQTVEIRALPAGDIVQGVNFVLHK